MSADDISTALADALINATDESEITPQDQSTMTEDELRSLIGQKLGASHHWYGAGKLVNNRIDADNYYNGEPLGNEIDGRSQVVSRDVAEAVDSIMPSLMRIFAAGDTVVKFEPFGPEDEEAADQATDYINYIFMQRNEGPMVLYNWFKDALLKRNGIIKIWYEKRANRTREVYTGLTLEQAQALQMNQQLEVLSVEEYPDETQPPMMSQQVDPATGQVVVVPQPVMAYDVTAISSKPECRYVVENVAPDEFVIERRAVSIEKATFLAHKVRRHPSELIALGYDPNLVNSIPRSDEQEYTQERIERFKMEDQLPWTNDEGVDKSMRPVWVTEAYIKVDYDGDGIAEWRQVILAGDDGMGGAVMLSNEEVDDHPFASLTPIPMPHKFYGMSLFDQIKDIQEVKTALWRGALDSIYLANAPRYGAVEGRANIDDLLDARPGGVVRVKDPNAVFPLQTIMASPQAFQMIEYIDTVKEQRTGVTRYNQGLDSDSLNKTATGVNIIANAGKERIELIARVFAETGVRRLFRRLFALTQMHQDKPEIIRLRGKWVEVNPRDWKDRMDVSVQVGIGLGNKDQQIAIAQQLLQMDAQIIQLQGGANGPILTLKGVYNKLAKLVEAVGWKSPEPYYQDPDMAPPQPPKPPAPDVIKDQLSLQMKNVDLEMKKIDLAMKEMETQINAAMLMAQTPQMELAGQSAMMMAQSQPQPQQQAPQQQQAPVNVNVNQTPQNGAGQQPMG